MKNAVPPLRDYEDFKRRVLALPQDKQVKILTKLYDLVYEKLDENVWRTMATAIKHAKDEGLEGHEDFKIDDKELKKLSHIQDSFRRKDR
jgi:DNA-binding ferritin-like protein (Dps family)